MITDKIKMKKPPPEEIQCVRIMQSEAFILIDRYIIKILGTLKHK